MKHKKLKLSSSRQPFSGKAIVFLRLMGVPWRHIALAFVPRRRMKAIKSLEHVHTLHAQRQFKVHYPSFKDEFWQRIDAINKVKNKIV